MIEPVVIGSAVLYRGDCLKWMSVIPDGSVDMILCDLPYGTTACKWDTVIPFEPLWAQYRRVAKRNAAIVLTATQPFTTALIASNMRDFRYCWVWDKKVGRGHLVAKKRPMARHEDVAVFYRAAPSYRPQMVMKAKPEKGGAVERSRTTICGGVTTGDRNATVVRTHSYPQTILSIGSESNKGKSHPTQKPVALMEYLIRTYTQQGETVLDNCMGSGTTGAACVNTGRNFIGIERDEKYFQIAADRIAESQRGQSRMFT